MDENFQQALELVLEYEGGYSNDEDDRGGPTKFGITKATARRLGYNEEISKLSKEEVAQMYYDNYWANLQYNLINDSNIALEMFDQAVNLGPQTANCHLQRACNLLIKDEIAVDGIVGPAILEAVVNCSYKLELIKLLNILQGYKYIKIVESDKSQKKFIRGWLKRVYSL
ncbi:glycosyl hydrolase 108 family protein [Halanaerocella petrolearia]